MKFRKVIVRLLGFDRFKIEIVKTIVIQFANSSTQIISIYWFLVIIMNLINCNAELFDFIMYARKEKYFY